MSEVEGPRLQTAALDNFWGFVLYRETMNWYVYMARNPSGRLYVGISPDVKVRLEKHNSGHGSRMGRQQGPFVLAYVSPAFPDKSSARLREVQIKGWRREKKEKLISGAWV